MVVLPLLASNGAFLLSAYEGLIPWCMPYIDGCSSISRAGRSGDTIFFYRALVFPYSILLMLFWVYSGKWLDYLQGNATFTARLTVCLGLAGSAGLFMYIDFLGAEGDVHRLMRRIGAALYFILIPVAQSLLLFQHYKIFRNRPGCSVDNAVIRYQFLIVALMLAIAVTSIILVMTGNDTSEAENIVEWNFSLLINLYSAGMVLLWKDYRQVFTVDEALRAKKTA